MHFDVCFCVNVDYFYCPNFWAIKLEVLLRSTATIEFNCYFQLQQRPALLESTAKAGDAVLCFCKTRQRSSNSGWWTNAECSSCGETVTICSQALGTTKTLSRRLLGTAGALASTKRMCVLTFKLWLGDLSPVQGKGASWDETCPRSGSRATYRLEMANLTLERNAYHELTVSTSLHKFFSNREICKP